MEQPRCDRCLQHGTTRAAAERGDEPGVASRAPASSGQRANPPQRPAALPGPTRHWELPLLRRRRMEKAKPLLQKPRVLAHRCERGGCFRRRRAARGHPGEGTSVRCEKRTPVPCTGASLASGSLVLEVSGIKLTAPREESDCPRLTGRGGETRAQRSVKVSRHGKEPAPAPSLLPWWGP